MHTEPPSRRVYSTITTASAPSGNGAPVMISTASPDSQMADELEAPAANLSNDRKLRRCARHDRPRARRSHRGSRGANGGKSRSARISAASTRPSHSSSETFFDIGERQLARRSPRRAPRLFEREKSRELAVGIRSMSIPRLIVQLHTTKRAAAAALSSRRSTSYRLARGLLPEP